MEITGGFYYGLSGIVLPIPKRSFPPEHENKSRLEYYATLFNSLEINSSFYKLPQAVTVAKWAAAVPDNFRFTFKLSKDITHRKGLAFVPEHVEAFMKVIGPAEHKSGSILVQFPPSLTIDALNQLQALLAELAFLNNGAWQPAVEFRHRSWYQREVMEILQEYNACMVLHDLPASATPPQFETGQTVYLRLHGPAGGYRGSYDMEALKHYAHKINEWRQQGKQVYTYFNNTMGEAVKNLQTLISTLQFIR